MHEMLWGTHYHQRSNSPLACDSEGIVRSSSWEEKNVQVIYACGYRDSAVLVFSRVFEPSLWCLVGNYTNTNTKLVSKFDFASLSKNCQKKKKIWNCFDNE